MPRGHATAYIAALGVGAISRINFDAIALAMHHMISVENPVEGGCACGAARYALTAPPMFVHCCHCRWCQRETGSAFVVNALVETNCLEVLKGAPAPIKTPSESGKGQTVVRCPGCQVALWSHYPGIGPAVAFLRAPTLDKPDAVSPDIHIFTSSMQPWVRLGDGIPAVTEYYRRSDYWPAASIERLKIARAR